MAWPKGIPMSATTMVAALEEMVKSLAAMQVRNEGFLENALKREDAEAEDRLAENVDILQEVQGHLTEALERLEEWPTAE